MFRDMTAHRFFVHLLERYYRATSENLWNTGQAWQFAALEQESYILADRYIRLILCAED